MDLIKKVEDLIKEPIEKKGYKLDTVEYVKEGSTKFLRVIIDKESYITVDDCVIVCRVINPILDKEDPIKENYILDVCSKERGSEYDEQ